MCFIANVCKKLSDASLPNISLATLLQFLVRFLTIIQIQVYKNCIMQRKLYKYIYFCSPLPDLARHSPKSRSPPSPFSLIQTEAKCINCVSVCIKREKIVYTHASTYIFVLYTYNYTIKILPCPGSFAFLSFSFYTIFKLYLISLFLVLYNSIQLYIPCQVSFVFLSFSFYTNSNCI